MTVTLPLWVVFLPILLAVALALFIIGDLINDWVIDPWLARRTFPELDRSEQLDRLHEMRRRIRAMGR